MDDGSRQNSGLYLSIYYFSNEDVDKLIFILLNKINFKFSIH